MPPPAATSSPGSSATRRCRPIGGILIADYFPLRKTEYDLNGLFRKDGPYWYSGGFNPAAIIALVVAVIPNVPGFAKAAGFVDEVAPIWSDIYTYAWFVGFFIAGGLYLASWA